MQILVGNTQSEAESGKRRRSSAGFRMLQEIGEWLFVQIHRGHGGRTGGFAHS
jgi:hypothetical protein